jgi:hypothetical protein
MCGCYRTGLHNCFKLRVVRWCGYKTRRFSSINTPWSYKLGRRLFHIRSRGKESLPVRKKNLDRESSQSEGFQTKKVLQRREVKDRFRWMYNTACSISEQNNNERTRKHHFGGEKRRKGLHWGNVGGRSDVLTPNARLRRLDNSEIGWMEGWHRNVGSHVDFWRGWCPWRGW